MQAVGDRLLLPLAGRVVCTCSGHTASQALTTASLAVPKWQDVSCLNKYFFLTAPTVHYRHCSLSVHAYMRFWAGALESAP